MIDFAVDQSSVDRTIEHLDAVRLRIFAAVREGFEEGMVDLAGTAVAEMGAAGIQNRTGELAENILKSPRVNESRTNISGRVKAQATWKLGGRSFLGYLGTALDEGYSVPGVEGALYQFSEPGEGTLFARGHTAFDVRPHPFLRQAQEAWAPTFLELIATRVNDAVAEANA
jgi:hypothetical protein